MPRPGFLPDRPGAHPLGLILGGIGGMVVVVIVRMVWGPAPATRKQQARTT